MIASLPMYDTDRHAVEQLWQALAARLRLDRVEGVPHELSWPTDLGEHWLSSDLLLSQTCGYPLTHHLLHHVQLLGAFHYAVPGCTGARYSSTLIARVSDAQRTFSEFAGGRLAANARDSQSGFHSLSSLVEAVRPGASIDAFFGEVVISGAHRQSIEVVRSGRADLAAVDCVTLAGLQRAAPQLLDGLVTVGSTPLTPGLPLITSRESTPAVVRSLRRALHDIADDPGLYGLRQSLFIADFEELSWADYGVGGAG